MRTLMLPWILVAACDTTTIEVVRPCTVELEVPSGVPVEAGDTLTLAGAPLSTPWDTRVRIGGLDAPVSDVVREACLHADEKTTFGYVKFVEKTGAMKAHADAFTEAFLGLAKRGGSHA